MVRVLFHGVRVDHMAKGTRGELVISLCKSVLEKRHQFAVKTLIEKDVLIDTG